ncbi:MAG: cupin domain-containing protein [Alteromonadaceae bacterium]|nr:cupin domain-containing protein [Alteromonadaceae bacterium]
MMYIRRAEERGKAHFGWLDSKHSFSFGQYYDPQHMGISVLRVINDDIVSGGAGFGMHGHQDMEIISYVIDGTLEHKDNQGNQYRVTAGEVQRMSAGTGVMHSEYNASQTNDVNFLQIWILPKSKGIQPGYEQKRIAQQQPLTPLVTPDGSDGSISMHQDASIHRLRLTSGESHTLSARQGYLHVIKGRLTSDELILLPGDAVAPSSGSELNIVAQSDVEALWFDLPIPS